ncbi:hypothetical protein AAHE18_10G179700 [Arachis hypogaea]
MCFLLSFCHWIILGVQVQATFCVTSWIVDWSSGQFI